MVSKVAAVEKLGERSLLLPQYVNAGLQANDRVKYYLSLLQAAEAYAISGDGNPGAALRRERLAAGESDAALDSVAPESERLADGQLRIPQFAVIHQRIEQAISDMARPLSLGADEDRTLYTTYMQRFGRLGEAAPQLAGDLVPADYIAAITGADRKGGDSLHLLVMDLHKELNRLQGEIAEESIRGARVYGLQPGDRALVEAFQDGVNTTAPLKFDHPGLGTTATRAGERLLIQNDIGTTEAHVIVIQVVGLTVTLTYSDVHLPRVRFFRSLLDGYLVDWGPLGGRSDTNAVSGETFFTALGRYQADTPDQLLAYLQFLGSRLVFLIDWNKARKRLRALAGKAAAVSLLTWAANENYGHRAFLELGGEEMIYEAIRHSSGLSVEYGQTLETLLGAEALQRYLQFVLRTASVGLTSGRPRTLIQDEVKAELLRQFHGIQDSLFELATRQTELIFDLACAVRDGLLLPPVSADDQTLEGIAGRARTWEHEADQLVRRSAELAEGRQVPEPLAALVPKADDIADDLEEAAFLLGKLPLVAQDTEILQATRKLAELVVQGAQEFVKSIANAALIGHSADRDDVQDFLGAVNRVVTIERDTDIAQRDVTEHLVGGATDARQLYLFSELVRRLERSTDAMARCALSLRDFVLGDALWR